MKSAEPLVVFTQLEEPARLVVAAQVCVGGGGQANSEE